MQKIRQIINKILSNSHKKEIFQQSLIAFSIKIIALISVYIFLVYVSNIYGKDGAGILTFSMNLLRVLSMFAVLGLRTLVLRYIWEYKAKKEEYKIVGLYKSSFVMVLISSICYLLILVFFADIIAAFFKDVELGLVFKVVWLSVPFLAILTLNISFIRGFKKISLSEFFNIPSIYIFGLIFLFISVYYLQIDKYFPLYAYVIGVFISFLVTTLYVIYKTFKLKKSKEFIKHTLSKKTILATSIPMMVTSFTFIVISNIDSFMIKYFMTIWDVWIYNIAFKIATITSFVLTTISAIVAPKIAELYWWNKMWDLKKSLEFASKLLFFGSFPILLIVLLFPEFLLSLFWEDFIEGKSVLIILALGQFVNVITGAVGFFMNTTWNEKIYRNITLFCLFINIVLNLLLIPVYGILGAAIATMFTMILNNMWAALYVRKKYSINMFYIPFLMK